MEALSAPGLRFHRALAPFLQLVVGSAHPAVGGSVRVQSFFLLWFSCHLVYIFIFIIFVVLRVPLLTFGPPGRFFCRGGARRGE